MNSLMDVLKEQTSFGFTGKVNVLLTANGQFQGVIYLHEGNCVGAHLGSLKGKKALFKMIFDDVDSRDHFKFIVEPELIPIDQFIMKLSFDEVKKEAQDIYQKYVQAKKLRPPPDLKLIIDPEIIVSADEISSDEFDILSILTEWCKVSDIYKHSKLMEFEVTNALVTLRKKRAIKVFQN